MFSGWFSLPVTTVTGEATLEQILIIGLTVIVFALGFGSGNTR